MIYVYFHFLINNFQSWVFNENPDPNANIDKKVFGLINIFNAVLSKYLIAVLSVLIIINNV